MDYRKIFLNQIPAEGLILNLAFSTDQVNFVDETISLSDQLKFKGVLRPISNRYLLSGRCMATINLTCDRCLCQYEYPVEIDIIVHYVVRKSHDQQLETIESDSREELDDVIDDRINLLNTLMEQIILQIPMKALCSDDCKGLCSQCGANLNHSECDCNRESIDPRLLKLKKLLEK